MVQSALRPVAVFSLGAAFAAACSSGRASPAPGPAPSPAAGTAAATAGPAPSAIPPGLRIQPSEAFTAAVERKTRTATGEPGPRYWQQYARYRLQAELQPVTKRLSGRGSVIYLNRSPDTLPEIYVHVYNNLFAPDAKRNQQTPKLGGVEFERVAVGGRVMSGIAREGEPGYTVDGTVMQIRLPSPLAPGDSLAMDFAWQYRVPSETAPRGGQDGEVWYLSYWYPQVAVYDDINGWQTDQYLGQAEFYMGYADYDVALTLPTGWLVGATGSLQNPAEVLSPRVLARLDSARGAQTVVRVVTEQDRLDSAATARGAGGRLTWRYRAMNVRDFAWGTSPRYLWDAVGASTGAGTSAIYAFYRPEGRRSYWDEAARYGRHSIEFFSKLLWPYPYPHMTAMDGPVGCGGMEYPMMTCIGGQWDSLTMQEVVTHEIGHMWFPMMVGSDEKRFTWMDEGLTQYLQSQSIPDFYQTIDDEAENRRYYLQVSQAGLEEQLMKHGDRYYNEVAFGVAGYHKPATALVALRQVLGRETFEKAMREYGRRWMNKHPTPFDFWNTVESVSGQDLDWFWKTWFYETWRLDQAIAGVVTEGDSTRITVVNRDKALMPVVAAVTREGGQTDTLRVPVEQWFDGRKELTVTVPASPKVVRVELDPADDFPDVNRGNGAWPRGSATAERRPRPGIGPAPGAGPAPRP
jgi:hypothetical protein